MPTFACNAYRNPTEMLYYACHKLQGYFLMYVVFSSFLKICNSLMRNKPERKLTTTGTFSWDYSGYLPQRTANNHFPKKDELLMLRPNFPNLNNFQSLRISRGINSLSGDEAKLLVRFQDKVCYIHCALMLKDKKLQENRHFSTSITFTSVVERLQSSEKTTTD